MWDIIRFCIQCVQAISEQTRAIVWIAPKLSNLSGLIWFRLCIWLAFSSSVVECERNLTQLILIKPTIIVYIGVSSCCNDVSRVWLWTWFYAALFSIRAHIIDNRYKHTKLSSWAKVMDKLLYWQKDFVRGRNMTSVMRTQLVFKTTGCSKKRHPCFNFAITSVNVHRF